MSVQMREEIIDMSVQMPRIASAITFEVYEKCRVVVVSKYYKNYTYENSIRLFNYLMYIDIGI